MGETLDAQGNPYYKKLETDNIVYNPYTWGVARALSWNDSVIKVNIYVAYRYVDPEYNCNPIGATKKPRLDIW